MRVLKRQKILVLALGFFIIVNLIYSEYI